MALPRERHPQGQFAVNELLDALVGESEHVGGVAAAEAEVSQSLDRFRRLLLRLLASDLGIVTGSSDPCGNGRDRGGEMVLDDEGAGVAIEPECQCFADSCLCLSEASAVGLAALDAFDVDVPGVGISIAFVHSDVLLLRAPRSHPLPRQISSERSMARW
jgi:hypothetical protein